MSSDPSEPNFGTVLDWLEGRLPADRAAQVQAAVASGAPALQRTVTWIRAYLAASQHVQLASSPALRARLLRLFEGHTRQGRRPSALRRYVAALASDSGLRLGRATGVRGVADTTSRQLLYSAEVVDIVLNVKTGDGKADVQGQVFINTDPNTEASAGGLVVQLVRDSVESAITSTSDTGHFAFADLSPGEYEIVTVADQFEVQIASVTIGA